MGAWYARYICELPSMRYRTGFEGGAGIGLPAEIFTISLAFMPTSARRRLRAGAGVLAALAFSILSALSASCGGGLFRQFEYEEDVYVSLDGSAAVYVNSS